MIITIRLILLGLLLFTSLAILATDTFICEVIYLTVFSLLMTLLYLLMSAPDVAITESAVGACITTLLLLWTVAAIGKESVEKPSRLIKFFGLISIVVAGSGMLWAITDLPIFGSAFAPVNNDLYGQYIENSKNEFGFPNVVTAILAGFRGYDTFGETVVIFTAAAAVLLLIGSASAKTSRKKKHLS